MASSSALIAAFLSALNASPSKGAPAGHLYAGLMSQIDLDTFNAVLGALVAGRLVTHEHHYVQLTVAGSRIADQCDAILAEARAEAKGVRS